MIFTTDKEITTKKTGLYYKTNITNTVQRGYGICQRMSINIAEPNRIQNLPLSTLVKTRKPYIRKWKKKKKTANR